ncbi:MAG: hypothetical protein J6S82_03535, partial [Bacteroidales bacterium]|nr:hypothetical protein [Bacteroidales bacterium]
MRKSGVIVVGAVLFLCGIAGSAAAGNAAPEPKKSYDELWKSFTECLQKELPESAAITLDSIEQKALKENNQTQLLKSWINRQQIFRFTVEDDPQQEYIRYLESKVGRLDEVHNALLHEEIAQTYANYLANHGELFFNSPLEGDLSNVEMKYWDSKSLRSRINAHFAEALKPVGDLKKAETKDFMILFDNLPKNVEDYLEYEKTVYEYLFHRAAEYYQSRANRDCVEGGMNTDEWWLPAKDFVKVDLGDNISNPLIKCLEIYQELIAYHLNGKNENVLIDNDFKRYGFVNSILQDANLYQASMENLKTQHADNPLSAEITALMANNLINQYERNSSDSIYFDNYRKAKELCEQAIAKFPNSKGAENCRNLIKQIEQPQISLSLNDVQLPNEAIPAVLEYRNTTRPYYRIVNVSEKDLSEWDNINKHDLLEKLQKRTAVVEQELILPAETDYRSHKTLIAIPALEKGIYFLIASTRKDSAPENELTLTSFQVSNLGFIADNKERDNGILTVIVVDRKTGMRVDGVIVEAVQKKWDYKTRKHHTTILTTLKSDKNGEVIIEKKHFNSGFSINLRKGDDNLLSENNFYLNYNDKDNTYYFYTYIFTDRAIYRPGQTVNFQGIVIRSNDGNKNVELVKGYTEKISLLDANRQEIASTEFVTDEYGSFSGSFVLPTDRMNGWYMLSGKSGNQHFRVEEYKRPTFEVTFEKPKEQYKLNQEITVHGNVMAYAGFGLDDVEYSYRVVRKTSFPWRCWWWDYPAVGDEQIAYGVSHTDEKGAFAVTFNLKPSLTIAPEKQPLFIYEIEVTATSRQGETHTNRFSIRAGYNEIVISTNLPSKIDIKELWKKYQISVANLSGEPAKSRISRKIYRYEEAVKPNYFEAMDHEVTLDRKILSDKELEKLFPNYSFYDSKPALNGKAALTGLTLASEYEITVEDTRHIFGDKHLKPGKYVLELVSLDDPLAKISKEFTVYEKNSPKMPVTGMEWACADKNIAHPGEEVNLLIGSSAKNVEIMVQLLHGNEVRMSKRITVSNSVQTL